ncbi:hypothetical protein PM8797T_06365 [Gimesia maris DSM 8797]|nr:hypothetical protein PM8797T_06365 [Gimesia maris DSM 8797]
MVEFQKARCLSEIYTQWSETLNDDSPYRIGGHDLLTRSSNGTNSGNTVRSGYRLGSTLKIADRPSLSANKT